MPSDLPPELQQPAGSEARAVPALPVHRNCFDAVRLIAAVAVLFSHQFSLFGLAQPFEIAGRTLGEIAVDVFFVVSGYLILESWMADPHLIRFSFKRFLRLYPAYVVAIFLTVFILGPLLTSLQLAEYFQGQETWHYLFDNLRMHVNFGLPGVFTSNPFPLAVNGSLWTLPYEIRWYLFLAVFGVLTLLRFKSLVAILWAVIFIRYFFLYNIDAQIKAHGDHRWAEEFGVFFTAGMLLHVTRQWWQQRVAMLIVVAALAALALLASGRPNASVAALLPVLSITIGRLRFARAALSTRFGDLSYGIYIYAFPVQQTVVALTKARLGLWPSMALSLALTLVLAALSWHLIEKRALRLKRLVPRPHGVHRLHASAAS